MLGVTPLNFESSIDEMLSEVVLFEANVFVLGQSLGALANSTHPLLSSKIVECVMFSSTIRFVALEISRRRLHIRIRSLVA